MIGQEFHADGGVHFHIVLILETQPNKSIRFFDIQDPKTNVSYHPNIKSASIEHHVLYCTKEDKEPLIKGFNLESLRKKVKEKKDNNTLEKVVEVFEREGYNKALDFFLEKASTTQKTKFTTRVRNILKTLQEMHNRLPPKTANFDLDAFYKVVGIENFFKIFSKNTEPGAMFIGGVSNAGKTHYIEALLTKLSYRWITVSDFEDLKSYDLHSVDFIIFDDVNFEKIKHAEDFLKLFEHLRPMSIPCRIWNPIIPAGVGRIFLSNMSFYELLVKKSQDENIALIRRVFECVIIYYLSPHIKRNPKAKAVDYYPEHQDIASITNINNITINVVNSTVNGDLNINPRDFTLPEYYSVENQINDINSFVDNYKITDANK